eukprot:870528-Prorocentrum_minimum.AAC.1
MDMSYLRGAGGRCTGFIWSLEGGPAGRLDPAGTTVHKWASQRVKFGAPPLPSQPGGSRAPGGLLNGRLGGAICPKESNLEPLRCLRSQGVQEPPEG